MIPPFNEDGYLPLINMELVNLNAFHQFMEKTFATDRDLVCKGMVDVVL